MGNENLKKETNLAYGGQALIEGIMMRGRYSYAFTVKQPDGTLYKEKHDHVALGKKVPFLGLPFIRGIAGFFENMLIGYKVLGKSADIAFPEEKKENDGKSKVWMTIVMILTMVVVMAVFIALPRILTELFKINKVDDPFTFNVISRSIGMIFFILYLTGISFMKDTKRLFGYHGAEHKTIHTYENEKDLTVENVKNHSRLHPRCGTSFIFIVMLVTFLVFPFLDIFIYKAQFLSALPMKLKDLLVYFTHIFIGMPIVASISYELLKLSGKFYRNFIVKLLVSPGLLFQKFTTREPDEEMIKSGIVSLNLVLGVEDVDSKRMVSDDVTPRIMNPAAMLLMLPLMLINLAFDFDE